MEKIASIRAVYIVSTRHVTGSTETVCVMANLVNSNIYKDFVLIDKRILYFVDFFLNYADRMQDVETNDEASSTLWIVAFCISVVIHIIRISATLIRRFDMKDVFCHFERQTIILYFLIFYFASSFFFHILIFLS